MAVEMKTRRRRTLAQVDELPLPSLDETLVYVQRVPAFLHFDEQRGFDLWSPHNKIPIRVRRALRKHQEVVYEMMVKGDSRTCPSPALHRWSWCEDRAADTTICLYCREFVELQAC